MKLATSSFHARTPAFFWPDALKDSGFPMPLPVYVFSLSSLHMVFSVCLTLQKETTAPFKAAVISLL